VKHAGAAKEAALPRPVHPIPSLLRGRVGSRFPVPVGVPTDRNGMQSRAARGGWCDWMDTSMTDEATTGSWTERKEGAPRWSVRVPVAISRGRRRRVALDILDRIGSGWVLIYT